MALLQPLWIPILGMGLSDDVGRCRFVLLNPPMPGAILACANLSWVLNGSCCAARDLAVKEKDVHHFWENIL